MIEDRHKSVSDRSSIIDLLCQRLLCPPPCTWCLHPQMYRDDKLVFWMLCSAADLSSKQRNTVGGHVHASDFKELFALCRRALCSWAGWLRPRCRPSCPQTASTTIPTGTSPGPSGPPAAQPSLDSSSWPPPTLRSCTTSASCPRRRPGSRPRRSRACRCVMHACSRSGMPCSSAGDEGVLSAAMQDAQGLSI